MKTDVTAWTDQCLTCIRFRKRPTKQEQVAVKPTLMHPWAEVMVDCEGSSQPPDERGNTYTLTYLCCMCHAVFLEPMLNLSAREVRRAFARAIFRSGTIPKLLRSDRGPEFKNLLMKEFCALIGLRHRLGTPWRPVEQAGVERVHQEMQKILGILLLDVIRTVRSYWSELLVVVEFVIYTTPGPHGYTPRDIDRRWSVSSPLAKDLAPFEILEFEPTSDYVQRIFAEYRVIMETILKWYAASSEKRAKLANRYRRARELTVGMRVVYRDPRARAAGGRTTWKEAMTEPLVVVVTDGNKLALRAPDGNRLANCLMENCVIVSDEADDYERQTFTDRPEGTSPSI